MLRTPRVAYDVFKIGEWKGFGVLRMCRGVSEYVGRDGLWVRDPRHIATPFADEAEAREFEKREADQEIGQ